MQNQPFISICIPAYKRVVDLEKLLDSINQQSYKNFEVIVTDDSPTDIVKNFLKGYKRNFTLHYYKNSIPHGTPENWNESIRKANGSWIKLMHDDDYFANENSLSLFVAAIEKQPSSDVFYCAFMFEDIAKNLKQIVRCNWWDKWFLNLSPYHLLKRNYFGNPSCVLLKKTIPFFYDSRFKYIVDFAYYIELLLNNIQCSYIDDVLINVGLNEEQVTHYTYKNKSVQMYENHILFEKIGSKALRNIIAFDYYWRIYRNFNILYLEDIKPYYNGNVHKDLQKIISFQLIIPQLILKMGICSKILMVICYCKIKIFK